MHYRTKRLLGLILEWAYPSSFGGGSMRASPVSPDSQIGSCMRKGCKGPAGTAARHILNNARNVHSLR